MVRRSCYNIWSSYVLSNSFILARSAGLSSYFISAAFISTWIFFPSFETNAVSYLLGMSAFCSLFLYFCMTSPLSFWSMKS